MPARAHASICRGRVWPPISAGHRLAKFAAGALLFPLMAATAQAVPLINGATQNGTIASVGEIDTFEIVLSQDDSIVVMAGDADGSAFLPRLRLLDPAAVEIDSDFGNAPVIEHRALLGGTYTVEISDGSANGNQTGNYLINAVKTPGALSISGGDQGGALTNGSAHPGSIAVGDLDGYQVDAAVGDTLLISAGDTGNTALAPQLRLFDPNGLRVGEDTGNAPVLEWPVTVAGTYTVVVLDGSAGNDQAGTYDLHLVRSPGALTISGGDEGGALTNGAAHSGAITRGDLDAFQVDAATGDTLVISAGDTGTTALTPELRLFDPSGTRIDEDTGNAPILEHQATATGTYTVVVLDGSAGNDQTGTYDLHLVRTPGALSISGGDEGGALTNGSIHPGATTIGDIDAYQFQLDVDDSVVLRAGDTSDNTYRPLLRLYDPEGNRLNPGAVGSDTPDVEHRAQLAGTYTVIVGDGTAGNDSTGTYDLHMVVAPGPLTISPGDQGGTLVNGSVHPAYITIGDLDAWRSDVHPGNTLLFQAARTAPGIRALLRLYAPGGEQVAMRATSGAAAIEHVATEGGLYTIVFSDTATNHGSGPYDLHFASIPGDYTVPDGDEGGPLTNGQTVAGFISEADIDVWEFGAAVGAEITLEATDTGPTGLRPRLRLYNPGGVQVQSDGDSNQAVINWTALVPGNYTVVVDDATINTGGIETGPYSLFYTSTADVPLRRQVPIPAVALLLLALAVAGAARRVRR